jgi:pimeloyl-ACP methyl ester carboxylesterase
MFLTHAQIVSQVAASYSQKPTVIAGDQMRCVVTEYANEILICVPGTTDLYGWLEDCDIWPHHFPVIGWCHQGFGSTGLKLWETYRAGYRDSGKLVTIAGHSLGGAQASVMAVRHAAQFDAPFRRVTFGSPRVRAFWNLDFKHYMRKAALDSPIYWRAGDPICTVPNRLPLGCFLHDQNRLSIGKPVPSRFDDPIENHAIFLYEKDLNP